jgi:hypothetical protein
MERSAGRRIGAAFTARSYSASRVCPLSFVVLISNREGSCFDGSELTLSIDQYRATTIIATTMNAATSESQRSRTFDRDFAISSSGVMISLGRRLQFANEPANISGLHWV